MKDGLRFADSDMHVMEPESFMERYLDPAFRHRVTSPPPPLGGGETFSQGWLIDGVTVNKDQILAQYNRIKDPSAWHNNPEVMFALERGYDPESYIMGMDAEGVDIAVLFPSAGLNMIAREGMDPHLSHAICRAYNDWIHDLCRYNPARLKMVAMLPVHDVNLARRELIRTVREYGAVGAFLRPNYVNGRYWHSKYWDPLYNLLQEMQIPLCFHEARGAHNSQIGPQFGENQLMRHVACHPVEMQFALIAMMLGGIFEFFPKLKVAFLEAQSWWVPGLLGRMQWDIQNHKANVPFLKLTTLEYWQRNCFSAIEGTETDIGATVQLIGSKNICVSTDFPHFDSSYPNVRTNVLNNPSITPETGADILFGGARLYGFTDEDFQKADATTAESQRQRKVYASP